MVLKLEKVKLFIVILITVSLIQVINILVIFVLTKALYNFKSSRYTNIPFKTENCVSCESYDKVKFKTLEEKKFSNISECIWVKVIPLTQIDNIKKCHLLFLDPYNYFHPYY